MAHFAAVVPEKSHVFFPTSTLVSGVAAATPIDTHHVLSMCWIPNRRSSCLELGLSS